MIAEANGPASSPHGRPPLDDVMLAMDVVDTIRHQELIVERELNSEERRKQLVARLKSLYAAQGLDVPEHVLAEGVAARRIIFGADHPLLVHGPLEGLENLPPFALAGAGGEGRVDRRAGGPRALGGQGEELSGEGLLGPQMITESLIFGDIIEII